MACSVLVMPSWCHQPYMKATSTYSAYYNKKMLEEKIEFLNCIKEQINSEKKRKEEFKKVKNGSKKDLEK